VLTRLRAIIALMRNPRVSAFPKVLVVGAIAYILFPWDVVPDIAPIVGWIDDLMFLIGALTMLFNSAPKAKGPQGQGPIIDVTPEPPAAGGSGGSR
jgi:uncharacterized membrane protein YkvA (DUF1232 family)